QERMSAWQERVGVGLLPQTPLALLFALVVTAALIGMFMASKQMVITIGGAIVLLIVITASGNPRLGCLWGLILSAPLKMSKGLYMEFPEMGGGSAISIELSDLFVAALLAFILRDYVQGRVKRLRFSPLLFFWGAMMLLGVIDIVIDRLRILALFEIVRMLKCYLIF